MSIQRWDVWAIDLGDDDLDIDAGHDEQGEWCKWDEVQAEVARLTAERDRYREALIQIVNKPDMDYAFPIATSALAGEVKP